MLSYGVFEMKCKWSSFNSRVNVRIKLFTNEVLCLKLIVCTIQNIANYRFKWLVSFSLWILNCESTFSISLNQQMIPNSLRLKLTSLICRFTSFQLPMKKRGTPEPKEQVKGTCYHTYKATVFF